MVTTHRNVLAAVAAALTLLSVTLLSNGAWSQATRTIKTVVPYAPGGVADILARLLAEQIGRAGGPTLVIENRPGAGGVIGTEVVARAAPDGNTLLIVSTPFAIDPLLRKVNYDPVTSFEPICYLVNAPTVIVVNSASPYRTLADLLNAARARPGELTLASIGPGSTFHLGFEMLKRAAKVDMSFIPYPGNAPALNAVLGEHVTSMFGTYSNVAEYLKAGTLRALAVATSTRTEPLPDVPTLAEFGIQGHRNGRVVWSACAGEDIGGHDLANRRLVHCGNARPRGQGEARRPRALSGRVMRRGFRQLSSQTI